MTDKQIHKLCREYGVKLCGLSKNIVNKSNTSVWAKRIRNMSRKALETLVRDIQREQENKIINSQKFPGDGNSEGLKYEILQPQAQMLNLDIVPEFSKI